MTYFDMLSLVDARWRARWRRRSVVHPKLEAHPREQLAGCDATRERGPGAAREDAWKDLAQEPGVVRDEQRLGAAGDRPRRTQELALVVFVGRRNLRKPRLLAGLGRNRGSEVGERRQITTREVREDVVVLADVFRRDGPGRRRER